MTGDATAAAPVGADDAPDGPLIPRSKIRSAALTTLLAIVGATLALWLLGPVRVAVGPVTTGLTMAPAVGGPVALDVSPLGQVEIAPSYAPVRLQAEVADLDPAAVSDLITQGRSPEFDIGGTLPRTLAGAALTYVGVAALGAGLVAGIGRRSWRHGLAGAGVPFLALSACFWIGLVTLNTNELADMRTTGALALIPDGATNATRFFDDRDRFADNVASSTGATTDLYAGLFGTADPDHPDVVRILHISDLHLNSAALSFAGQLARTFDVDVVANTGDDADWGSEVESEILGGPVGIDVPYLWVRGNHDTQATQAANAAEGAVVLDGTETTVDDLVFFGVGDPTFSPKLDKAVVKEGQTKFKQRWSAEVMEPLYAAQPQVPDVVMTHDPAMTDAIEPKPPLRLAGHTHKLQVSAGTNPDGSPWVLVVNGSTGGAGLRVLDKEQENPMSAVIITVDRESKQALYLDEFSYRPLVDQTFKVRRIDLRQLEEQGD
ncbi:metallophosphoesterase family protein [Dermatobacter hominis]|uniref:metallophosphoesterase family protein n=1 Tax=Dermatobacter hominis TaxID=2884263 RepID=UPI001D10C97B|nr:metallophosphoesterase [Dermatobacter hominis]UDY37335.1 metallophosphoesterase [Dermatobacter hominis]